MRFRAGTKDKGSDEDDPMGLFEAVIRMSGGVSIAQKEDDCPFRKDPRGKPHLMINRISETSY